MLDVINIDIQKWNWQWQKIWWVYIPTLINNLKWGFYQTKEVELNIEVFDLSSYGFECNNLFEFIVHYKMVEDVSMDYPVILNREWLIIDWRHRLCKAIIEWRKILKWIMILDDKVID